MVFNYPILHRTKTLIGVAITERHRANHPPALGLSVLIYKVRGAWDQCLPKCATHGTGCRGDDFRWYVDNCLKLCIYLLAYKNL